MFIPRAPTPIVVSEPFYNGGPSSALDYEINDIPLIRASVPGLQEHTDAEISCLWRYYSSEVMCAGWMSFSEPNGFADFLEDCDFSKAWYYG